MQANVPEQISKVSSLKPLRLPRYNFSEGGPDLSDPSDLSDSRQELFIVQHCYSERINGMKEAAEMSENNASSIREAAQANGWQ